MSTNHLVNQQKINQICKDCAFLFHISVIWIYLRHLKMSTWTVGNYIFALHTAVLYFCFISALFLKEIQFSRMKYTQNWQHKEAHSTASFIACTVIAFVVDVGIIIGILFQHIYLCPLVWTIGVVWCVGGALLFCGSRKWLQHWPTTSWSKASGAVLCYYSIVRCVYVGRYTVSILSACYSAPSLLLL